MYQSSKTTTTTPKTWERGGYHRFRYGRPPYHRRSYCGNCGMNGHVYRNCKNPFTSLGIIAIRDSIHDTVTPKEVQNTLDSLPDDNDNDDGTIDRNLRCLMVQRKDSLGFINILRPRSEENDAYIDTYAADLTVTERRNLEECDFDTLWKKLSINTRWYNREMIRAKHKFATLDIKQLLNRTVSRFNHLEWGFPKGKRDRYESDLKSALREFEEETGYNAKDLTVISGEPLVENFIGLNDNPYMCKYFVAFMDPKVGPPSIDYRNPQQAGEISNLAWLSYNDARKIIRPNALDKKKVLRQAFLLAQYKKQNSLGK